MFSLSILILEKFLTFGNRPTFRKRVSSLWWHFVSIDRRHRHDTYQRKPNTFSSLVSGSNRPTRDVNKKLKLIHVIVNFINQELTLVQVVVLPEPCRPTNIITFCLPLVGDQHFTPASTSFQARTKYKIKLNK